jgi:hypothetical protein
MISVPWKWNIPTRSATRQATTFQTELNERETEKRETETESSGDGPNCDVAEEKA